MTPADLSSLKVIRHGTRLRSAAPMRGTCQHCDCRVEVLRADTKELIDRDTQPGMATRYVHCPECSNEHLWVQ